MISYIIGCGGIGSYHLGHLLQFTDFTKVVGSATIESELRISEQAQSLYRFQSHGMTVKPDAVFICVPRIAMAIEYETIRRGIHFFVEKPTALDLDLAKISVKKLQKPNHRRRLQCRYSTLVEPFQ